MILYCCIVVLKDFRTFTFSCVTTYIAQLVTMIIYYTFNYTDPQTYLHILPLIY